MTWILERLSEKTTWMGILAAVSALGLKFGEGLIEAIAGVGIAVAVLVLAIMKEKKA